jgi:formylglycine-generating enzyme required for sulfatase activity
LRLVELPNGRFRLDLKPLDHMYSAVEGQPIRYRGRSHREVQDWRRFPVSAVSFDDGKAFAAWLASTGRVPSARLCEEREWERAARGADRRSFPNGFRPEADDFNRDVTYNRVPDAFGPDEVGSHPASSSPFGVDDLAGNVWEWTRSATPSAPVTNRGGSFYHGDLTCRSTNRDLVDSATRHPLAGLRICADVL